MARLRAKHLPHRVRIRSVIETAEGDDWTEWAEHPAYVEQKTRLVVDRRSTSPTSGQEITSTTFVILLPGVNAAPRTQVEVWAGTPMERTSEVIGASVFDYPGTPGHVQLDLE